MGRQTTGRTSGVECKASRMLAYTRLLVGSVVETLLRCGLSAWTWLVPGRSRVVMAALAKTAHSRLRPCEVIRASDLSTVKLVDQWGSERAVVCFLRHFG